MITVPFGSVILFLGIITILPFTIGAYIKLKNLRYVVWCIGLLPFISLILTISSHLDFIKREKEKYSGSYKIDLQHSVSTKESLINYAGLILEVNTDGYFKLSDPFLFKGQSGTWEFIENEDGGYVDCKFKGQKKRYTIAAGATEWVFYSDCLTNGDEKDKIIFKKLSSQEPTYKNLKDSSGFARKTK